MAVADSREVVIEAAPDEIMDVLFDLESLPEWSSAHRQVEVLERPFILGLPSATLSL